MKTLRQLCAASVLALMLSLPAFAGEMSTTVAPPSPPANATTTTQTSTPITPDGDAAESGGASVIDSVTDATLNLLHSVLSLL